jgi:hypothetical protein
MDSDKFEKTIFINSKEVLLKIDKKIEKNKHKKIMDDFCKYIKQMKQGVGNIEKYRPSDFDYVVVLLVVKHCTDFLSEELISFVDVTLRYSELVSKNIIQQIFKSMSGSQVAIDIDKVIVTCRVMVQNEISIKKLENIYPSLVEKNPELKSFKIKNKEKEKNSINNIPEKSNVNVANKKESFEPLLDQYNDAKLLYDMFGDEEYSKKMKFILSKMRRKWKKVYGQ